MMTHRQVPDLPEEDPDVRGGGQAHEDRRYRGDNEEQVGGVLQRHHELMVIECVGCVCRCLAVSAASMTSVLHECQKIEAG